MRRHKQCTHTHTHTLADDLKKEGTLTVFGRPVVMAGSEQSGDRERDLSALHSHPGPAPAHKDDINGAR